MAGTNENSNTIKFLDLTQLQNYHNRIMGKIGEARDNAISSATSTAKGYTDTEIAKITSGDVPASKATYAESANTANTAASATSASKLSAERTITLKGDVSGSISFDGSKNVEASITVDNYTHNHDSAYDKKGDALKAQTAAEATAKEYTDAEIAKLLNNSTEAVDSIMELADAMEDNADAIEALNGIAANKQEQIDALSESLNSHTSNSSIHFTTTERTKLSGIDEGANKTIVDTVLSTTSENPVQNKVVNAALSGLTSITGSHTTAIENHTVSIASLNTAISNIKPIESSDITTLFGE